MLPFRLGLLSDCSETLEYPVRVRPPSKPFKIFSIFLFGSGLFLGHSETLVCPRLGRASFQVVPKFEYSLVWVGFPSRPFQNFSMPPFGLGLLLGRSGTLECACSDEASFKAVIPHSGGASFQAVLEL